MGSFGAPYQGKLSCVRDNGAGSIVMPNPSAARGTDYATMQHACESRTLTGGIIVNETASTVLLSINGRSIEAKAGERLIDVLLNIGTAIPHVCYLPILGPIQTCDTCIVLVDGSYVRACAETVRDGM